MSALSSADPGKLGIWSASDPFYLQSIQKMSPPKNTLTPLEGGVQGRGRLFEDILGFDEDCAETQDKLRNVSQAGWGKGSLVTRSIFSCLPFYVCLPIGKANPAVGRNCFQMTLWERKTHCIKKLQNKSRTCTLCGPDFIWTIS